MNLPPRSDRDLLPSRPHVVRRRRTGAAVRRVLCLGLVVLGVAALFVARPDTSRAAADTGGARLTTSLWSPRRSPQAVVEAVGVQRLNSELGAIRKDIDAGCIIVDAPGFGTVATVDGDRPLTGASTQKILTALVALRVLGPDYRYETRVISGSRPADGAVDKAWFVGSGDPVLHTDDYQAVLDASPVSRGNASTRLENLVSVISAGGTKSINTLLVDDTRYEAVRYLPTWKANYKTEGQVGSLGGLTVNSGFSSFDGLRVPADDPGLDAGNRLADLLRAKGISVGAVRRGSAAGEGSELGAVQSPPLREIVAEMLRTSDNTTAEMLVREFAAKASTPGTTASGVRVMSEDLAQLGINLKGVTLLDGSGLSRDNAVTCEALRQALEIGRQPGPARLDDLLAVAGVSGTLAPRFQDSPVQGKLAAKTGTLAGVTGLAGVLDTYRSVPFTFIANGDFTDGGAIGLQSRVVSAISRYPSGPAAASLVPAPAPPCTAAACR